MRLTMLGTGHAKKITNLGAVKIILGIKRFISNFFKYRCISLKRIGSYSIHHFLLSKYLT